MAFFFRWFVTATASQQAQARSLIGSGQIEFATAGWTMPDESNVDYHSVINGMTVGHEFISDSFGQQALPRFSFEVDPFGATRWIATMYALLGYDAHIVSRVDYEVKDQLQNVQGLEFVWRTNPASSDPSRTDIFTHMMDEYSYCLPPGAQYYFDAGSEPVTAGNVGELSDWLVADIRKRAKWFEGQDDSDKVLLWSWGCDFEFQNATTMFANMDKVLAHVAAANPDIELSYGHLSTYYKLLAAKSPQPRYKVYQGDFEPYDDSRLSYWTGYYTSRPVLKGAVRAAVGLLQAAEQALLLVPVSTGAGAGQLAVTNLRRAQAEATHHDAVAGTSTTPVTQMYLDHLARGAEAVQGLLAGMMVRNSGGAAANFSAEAPSARVAGGSVTVVALHNPLAWGYRSVERLLYLPAGTAAATVEGAVACQLNPDGAVWAAVDLPPRGQRTVVVSAGDGPGLAPCALGSISPGASWIATDRVNVTFNLTTGLSSTLAVAGSAPIAFVQSLADYQSWDNPGTGQTSGAYVFSPQGPAASAADPGVDLTVVAGPLVSEARQAYPSGPSNYTHVFRVYADGYLAGAVETRTSMGPMPGNVEAVTRFNTSLASGSVFYTDSNGLYVEKRQLDPARAQPIAGNYYPMVAHAQLRDPAQQTTLAFVSDRAHGFSSLAPGMAEVMVHRSTLQSDGKGPVLDDDTRVEDVPIFVLYGPNQDANRLRHNVSLLANYRPTRGYATLNYRPSGYSPETSPFGPTALPTNVHLLTLQSRFPTPMQQVPVPSGDSSSNKDGGEEGSSSAVAGPILIRLLHLYEQGEDPVLSQPAVVDLQSLLPWPITSIKETTLSGVWGTDRYSQRMKFGGAVGGSVRAGEMEGSVVKLMPMDIKTFLVQVAV